jgi:predicted unusual protein kinase regulating ubiquinone biosynthesis (AarF/ABC1/UbiB family)
MEGLKITRKEELVAAGVPMSEVAVRLVQAFYKMLLVDRFFHADPHPGNFLVEPLGGGKFRLVVLDFGAVCVARDALIDGMIAIVQGYFTQDDKMVVKGFRAMGFVSENANEGLLERTVKMYFGRLLKIRDRTPAALLKQRPEQLEKLVDPEMERDELQELMRSVEYPEDWFYVERACVLMFWLAAQLDPALDTMAAGFPYVMPMLAQRAAAQAAANA